MRITSTTGLAELLLGFLMALGTIGDAAAQASAIHSVSYVEARPASAADALAALTRYREATRGEDGNLRCEILVRLGQPHHLVVLEVWRDQQAFEAHGRSASTAQMRAAVAAIRIAPLDERVHVPVSVGALQPAHGGGAVHAVTHVDVIPPRKDDGLAALTTLAEASRAAPGNARFEVVQQTNRPNHFTVVETWQDAKAAEAHSAAEATRRFRDTLAPMSGSLYDERLYRVVD